MFVNMWKPQYYIMLQFYFHFLIEPTFKPDGKVNFLMSEMKYLSKLDYASFDHKPNSWSLSSLYFKEIHID